MNSVKTPVSLAKCLKLTFITYEINNLLLNRHNLQSYSWQFYYFETDDWFNLLISVQKIIISKKMNLLTK